MSDQLQDTPMVARYYCPGCEPDADSLAEILDIRWCAGHAPSVVGSEDAGVLAAAYLTGLSESGGADNRAWCSLIHRRARRRKGGAR